MSTCSTTAADICQDVFVLMSLCIRVKIMEQFAETVNQLKGQRQQTVQTHVCAALCSLLKVLHHSDGSECVYLQKVQNKYLVGKQVFL